MELKHLRVLVAAIEEGSIQAASRQLNIAQPALSRRIKDLEAMLGCELLVRNVKGVVPTEAGLALYRDALTILGSAVEAGERAQRLGLEQHRGVRLGLVQTARKYGFLQQSVGRFNQTHPQAGVALTRAYSRDLVSALRDGQLDASLLYERRIASDRIGERLIHSERYILAAHPTHRLAQPGAASLNELTGVPLVCMMRQDKADNHNPLIEQCRRHGLEPVVGQWANSPEELIDLVMVSGGVCITPASTILATPPGQLIFRALPDFGMELDVALGWVKAPASTVAEAFLIHLHGSVDDHQAVIAKGTAGWIALDGVQLFTLGES